jgi:hypothetical protein
MLRVKDWEQHFENNRTRELKSLHWAPVPNKQDGDGYTELMDHPNGVAHYGAWVAIVLVASKCDPRGTLSRDGARPHDAASVSRITRVPADVMSEAIERLVSIGWLERIHHAGQQVTEIPHPAAEIPQGVASRACAQEQNGMEWNGMEENGKEQNGTERAPAKPATGTRRKSDDVKAVFDYYRTHHPHAHKSPKPTSKEWRNIEARLAEGYTPDDLCQAIDGCHRCPHNLGQNDRQQQYLGLELIMRSGSHVSRFMEIAQGTGPPVLSTKTQRTVQAAISWAEKGKPSECDL